MVDAVKSPENVMFLQESAARGQPAERVDDVGGWWLRFSPDCSWWVGAVLPHGGAGVDDVTRRVVEAEEFYAVHGSIPRFQVTPRVCAEELDAVLGARGYLRHSSVSLQVADTSRVLERARRLHVRLDERPTRTWFATWQAVNGDSRAEWDMLARVDLPSAYASAMVGDEVVAVGRAVADRGWAGIFSMATLPRARGKGSARNVLATLADWAAGNGADRMYLQVERDNGPATRLYERAGFTEICAYHYRIPNSARERARLCELPGR
ncbi:GNAT family N-acetyltransferase [Actinomadura latina]|uniref:GNAT family N-acetyltransferase n=1 Tax=Actinomadura latina TaxID=163603 RepID=A0A846Z974_9ACTN|nr:GNAT family N-acetyltransferase [Actinomadura latina]NKZ06953.1 GNAT family N-acetyltransferase [Actinomadura latina]